MLPVVEIVEISKTCFSVDNSHRRRSTTAPRPRGLKKSYHRCFTLSSWQTLGCIASCERPLFASIHPKFPHSSRFARNNASPCPPTRFVFHRRLLCLEGKRARGWEIRLTNWLGSPVDPKEIHREAERQTEARKYENSTALVDDDAVGVGGGCDTPGVHSHRGQISRQMCSRFVFNERG